MCRQRNIRVGIQTCTLGHSPLPKNAVYQGYSFSEESWCVDDHGGKAYCCLCPTSPEVRAFFRETAKIYLETLKPDSFWPDDDMRLSYKGGAQPVFLPPLPGALQPGDRLAFHPGNSGGNAFRGAARPGNP
jgi:hypothetical protein